MSTENATTDTQATETSVAPKAEPAPKLTIAQKIEALQGQKTEAVSKMNTLPEGSPERLAVEESIKVMDRQMRWYNGRNGGPKAAKAERPSKAAKAKSTKVAKSSTKPADSAPVNAANES